MPSKFIPEWQRDAMVRDYINGSTSIEAAAKYGYSYMACIFALKKRGIDRRNRSLAHRRYSINEDFFNNIDSEEKAYWLGFLTADGTIGKKYLSISLQALDAKHLEKFKSHIDSEHPINFYQTVVRGKNYENAKLYLGSSKLAGALRSLGVPERKSLIAKPCNAVPKHLLPHYWRGIFDGDGGISVSKNNKTGYLRWSLSLVGSRGIVTGFASFCRKLVATKARVRPHANVYAVKYNGVALPKRIIQALYGNAKIYLERKMQLCNQLMITPVQRKNAETLNARERGEVHAARQMLHDEAGTERHLGGVLNG